MRTEYRVMRPEFFLITHYSVLSLLLVTNFGFWFLDGNSKAANDTGKLFSLFIQAVELFLSQITSVGSHVQLRTNLSA